MSNKQPDDSAWAYPDTHGSAHVSGNIHTVGGDFIGRDKNISGDEVYGDKIIYQGPTYPRLDYRSDIAGLINFYTQTFIGCEQEWQQLLRLAGQEAPGYLLIEALPGYGKSALIAQLVHRHETGQWGQMPVPELIYFFIRQQGQRHTPVAFLQAINSQLLSLLKLPGGVPPDLTTLRGQFSELWAQVLAVTDAAKPLLLLVDGLDELAPGEVTIAHLLPTHLTSYVHVVISSRPNPAPRRQVALEHPFRQAEVIPLDAFDEDEMKILLQQYGAGVEMAANLAPRVQVMTKGEPLFARFVCQEVVAEGESALVRLEQNPPANVTDYFRQQLEQLKAAAKGKLAREILGLLLVTLGGITIEEIAEVLDASKWDIDEAIAPIQRFLLGQIELGLMHQELRRTVATLFSNKELQRYKHKLLDYNQITWRQGGQYALSYLARHLYELGDSGQLLDLLQNAEWQTAQRQGDPTGLGLAQDVELACDLAARGGIQTLIEYTAASLLKARLKSSITNLPSGVIEVMAQLNQFDQALAIVDLMALEWLQLRSLHCLAKYCLEQGRVDQATSLLTRIRVATPALKQNVNAPNYLVRVAKLFSLAGQPEKVEETLEVAFELVDAFEDESQRNKALIALVRGMFDYEGAILEKWLARAEKMAPQIEKLPSYRALVLAYLAEQYQRLDVDHARALVREALYTLNSTLPSYEDGSPAKIKASDTDTFLTVIDIAAQIGAENEMITLLATIDDVKLQAVAHIALGKIYVNQGHTEEVQHHLQEAFNIARTELRGNDQDDLKSRLVNLLLRVPDIKQAQHLACTIQAQTDRVEAFCAIVEHLAQTGRVAEVPTWLKQMGVDWGQVFGHAIIANTWITSDPDTAHVELEQALQQARQIQEGIIGSKYDAYICIIEQVAKLARVKPELAEGLLKQIVNDLQSDVGRDSLEIWAVFDAKAKALGSLAELLAISGNYADSAKISRSIADGVVKDYTLLLGIRAACKAGDWDSANSFLAEIKGECMQLVGGVAIEGWQTVKDQPLDSLLNLIEAKAPQACHHPGRHPTAGLRHAAVELGNSGHLTAARALWTKMTNSWARQESQAELVGLFVQAHELETAQQLTVEMEDGKFKAEALAQVASLYVNENLSMAQELVKQAWQRIKPYETIPKADRSLFLDETLIVLVGTVALWDSNQANQIAEQWLGKESNRLRAKGKIIAVMATTNRQEAYEQLREIIAARAGEGLTGFWQALMACSEALSKLVGIQNVMRLHEHIVLIEKDYQ